MAKLYMVKTKDDKVKCLNIDQVVMVEMDDPIAPKELNITFANGSKETIKTRLEKKDDEKNFEYLQNDAMATAILGRYIPIPLSSQKKKKNQTYTI